MGQKNRKNSRRIEKKKGVNKTQKIGMKTGGERSWLRDAQERYPNQIFGREPTRKQGFGIKKKRESKWGARNR